MAAALPLRFHNIALVTQELNQDRRWVDIEPHIVMRVGAAGQKIREIELDEKTLTTLIVQAAVALDRLNETKEK